MDTLRDSLKEVENRIQRSSRMGETCGDTVGWARIGRCVAWALVAILGATNVATWRALANERAAQRASPPQRTQLATPIQPAWPPAVTRPSVPAQTQMGMNQPVVAALNRPTIPSGMTSGFRLRLAQRLADPKFRDVLRGRQRWKALDHYAELLKRWHMTGSAAAGILDALADYQTKQIVSMLSGPSTSSGGNAAEDSAVEAVLTGTQLQQLRAYDASMGERMSIAPFLSELQVEGTPLPEDQVDQLVDIMYQERLTVPRPDAPTSPEERASYTEALNEWQNDLDQRIRERAGGILSSDAISQLEAFQNSRRATHSVFASIASEIWGQAATAASSGSN